MLLENSFDLEGYLPAVRNYRWCRSFFLVLLLFLVGLELFESDDAAVELNPVGVVKVSVVNVLCYFLLQLFRRQFFRCDY